MPKSALRPSSAGESSSSPSQRKSPPGPNRRLRVLVVDDDLAVRESLSKVLCEAGYEAVLAADGQEALQQVEQQPIDLLILDLRLPNKYGWDAFEQIKRMHPLLPIITTV